jgi:hypothetical protein
MVSLRKKITEKRRNTRIAKRLRVLSVQELVQWGDQCVYETGRCLSIWANNGDNAAFDEAQQGAEAVVEILAEIRSRTARP